MGSNRARASGLWVVVLLAGMYFVGLPPGATGVLGARRGGSNERVRQAHNEPSDLIPKPKRIIPYESPVPSDHGENTEDFEKYIAAQKKRKVTTVPAEEFRKLFQHHKRLKRFIMTAATPATPIGTQETSGIQKFRGPGGGGGSEVWGEGQAPSVPDLSHLNLKPNKDSTRYMDGVVDKPNSESEVTLYEDDPDMRFFGDSSRLSGKSQSMVDHSNQKLYALVNDFDKLDAYAKALAPIARNKHIIMTGDGSQGIVLAALRYGARRVTVIEPEKELAKSLKGFLVANQAPISKVKVITEGFDDLQPEDIGGKADIMVNFDFGPLVTSLHIENVLISIRSLLKDDHVTVPYKATQYFGLINSPGLRRITACWRRWGNVKLGEFNHYKNTDGMISTIDLPARMIDLNFTQITQKRTIFEYTMTPIERTQLPDQISTIPLKIPLNATVDAIMTWFEMRMDREGSYCISTHPRHSNLERDVAVGQAMQLVEDHAKKHNHLPAQFKVTQGETVTVEARWSDDRTELRLRLHHGMYTSPKKKTGDGKRALPKLPPLPENQTTKREDLVERFMDEKMGRMGPQQRGSSSDDYQSSGEDEVDEDSDLEEGSQTAKTGGLMGDILA